MPNREQLYTYTQILVTVALTAAVIYMEVSNQPSSELLNTLTTMAVGYFLGTKGEQLLASRLK